MKTLEFNLEALKGALNEHKEEIDKHWDNLVRCANKLNQMVEEERESCKLPDGKYLLKKPRVES